MQGDTEAEFYGIRQHLNLAGSVVYAMYSDSASRREEKEAVH